MCIHVLVYIPEFIDGHKWKRTKCLISHTKCVNFCFHPKKVLLSNEMALLVGIKICSIYGVCRLNW